MLLTHLSASVGSADGHLLESHPTPLSAALPRTSSCAKRSLTQPAAEIAAQFRWRIDAQLGHLCDATGLFIAVTLGDAMIAMLDLGWITIPSLALNQNAIPTNESIAANDVRLFLNIDGTAYETG